MNKIAVLIMCLPLGFASPVTEACIGQISEAARQELIEKLDQDFVKTKLRGWRIVHEDVMNESIKVGSRGNCSAVLIERVRRIEYKYEDVTCSAFAASELKEGHPFQPDAMTHILSVIGCERPRQ